MVSKSPSRSHGEGSIYRSDHTRPGSGVTVERWIASVDLGVGPNGKRRRKRITGPTRKAVADELGTTGTRREESAAIRWSGQAPTERRAAQVGARSRR